MTASETSVPKGGRWLKRLAWAGAGLVVLVVVLYLVATSSAFFKGFVLPRLSRSLNTDVSVSSAEISPFSKIVLHDLKVSPAGAEPILAATTVSARYSLWAILRGHYVVDEVAIVSPTVTIIENPDGTSNLSPLGSTEAPKTPAKPAPAKPEPAGKPSPPLSLDVKSFRLENANLRYSKSGETIELKQVNVTAANIKNDAAGTLTFAAAIAMDKTGSTLQAKLEGAFNFTFSPNMQPRIVAGAASLSIDSATGELADLATLGAKLECDVSPTEIKQCSLAFTKAGTGQGNVRVSGPFDGAKMEGKLKVEVLGIDRQVLNLMGASAGLDFGPTTINTSNEIELTKSGTIITAAGSLNVARLQVTRQKQSSPTLDLHCDYSVAVDQPAHSLTLKTLQLVGKQNERRLVQLELSNPMTIAWGGNTNAVGDATLTFAVTELNLADWKPLAGDDIPKGIVNLNLKVLSQQGGRQLGFDWDSKLNGLSLRADESLDLRVRATGRYTTSPQAQTVTGQFALSDLTGQYDEYRFDKFGATLDLELLMKGNELEFRKVAGKLRGGGKFDLSGNYDSEKKSGQFVVKLVDFKEGDLRPFLQPSLGDQKLVSVTLNTAVFAGFNATGEATVKGELRVANLVVQDPASAVPATPLEARLQLDAAANKSVLTLHQCQLTLTPTARANNELQLTGKVDYAKSDAITGNLKLTAAALDLTKYYDLFEGTNVATETTASTAPVAPPTKSNTVVEAKEPEAVKMPFRDFTFIMAVDRCYLRELDITNLQTTAKLDGAHIVLKPFQVTLNGGPVSADLDLDLGVPGYKYDIVFTADNVPLGPLADSFSPTYRDSADGTLSGKLQLKGAGVAGRSLRKNLTGKVTLSVTNANIQIVGAKAKKILTPISLALGAPELLSKPLDYLATDLRFGHGEIEVREFTARSAAVLVETPGTIPIADVLSDSPLDQPINLSLSHQLAHRLHPNTPAEEGYAKWPTMVRLVGTLGDPGTKTFIAQSVEAVTNALGKTTSTIKKGFGKVFSGGTTNSTGSTNAGFHPLNLFKKSEE